MVNDSVIWNQIAHMVCGEKIGTGQFREVHACRLDPTNVVKLENHYNSFYNIMEWQIWQVVKDTDMAKWFAPCEHISGSGSVLIMKRTTPTDRLPTKVPAFFDDLKPNNWGKLGTHTVCHDYGHNSLIEYGLSVCLKKAEWL